MQTEMPAQFLELTAPSPPPSVCSSPCCSYARNADLPNPLLDLLSNSLILHHTAPYLPVSSLFSLARTSRRFHGLLLSSTEAFRYLNLSAVPSADAAPDDVRPIDIGGRSWRAERMDEALTEDEFYCGPLLGIFARLASPRSNNVLATVSTLVLDGLTVPADLVREIVAEDRFRSVRILSIRGVKHLNERKLRQVLRYAVRPGRPEGTPRLKGLYIFGAKDVAAPPPRPRVDSAQSGASGGVTRATGAQLGASWNARSAAALHDSGDKCYAGAGRVLKKSSRTPNEWVEWAELLLACEGIIAFDGVLCRGPRHDTSNHLNWTIPEEGGAIQTQDYTPTAIATVSLNGCEGCGGCVEGATVFGDSKRTPLLAPVPLFASTVRACQIPPSAADETNPSSTTQFIARCEDCLRSRWCERCNVWWCEQCYMPPSSQVSSQWQGYQPRPNDSTEDWIGQGREDANGKRQMGSKRSCFGCGQTCAKCTAYYSRTCRICRNGYCLTDNEGSTLERCDWCNSGARRTRNLH